MSHLHLTLKSKTLLYNQLIFFKAKVIFPKTSYKNCRSGFSFFKLLILHFFTYKLSINLIQQIVLTKIVAVNKSFLYFNAVSKFTIVKPKFKFFFPGVSSNSLLKKNLLLVANFSFLKFLDLKAVLTRFLYFSIKNSLQIAFTFCFPTTYLSFKKIKFFSLQFLFFKVYKFILSSTQKKINFLQFNIFLKNINIPAWPYPKITV